MPHHRRRGALVLLVSAAVCAGIAGDWLLGRPDRTRLGIEKGRLRELRDAIQRFALDRGRPPQQLADLVPGYAAAEMLRFQPDRRDGATAAVRWEPGTGSLSWSVPFVVRGLVAHARRFEIHIPPREVVHDPLRGENAFRQTQTPVILGPEDIVVEAEHFQFLTYGWEIEENQSASGECCIHLKEGVGDISHDSIEFDPHRRAGDFYNVTRDRARIEARCYVSVPADGDYYLAVRSMGERSSCSNIILAMVDDTGLRVGENGSEPFVWLWWIAGRVYLKRGVHALSFRSVQDGVRVDQAIFTRNRPSLVGSPTFSGGQPQGEVCPEGVPPLTLSLSVDTLTLTAERDPTVAIYVRKSAPAEVHADLQISLDLPGRRAREEAHDLVLPAAAPLTRFPCRIDLPRPLDRKEYLLRCRLTDRAAGTLERTLVLYHGYDWSILGPLPYLTVDAKAEPEADPAPAASYSFAGKPFTWQPFDPRFADHFALMDFGMMFSGRVFDAMPAVSLYAYTEIEVAAGGEYLLKAQGDDHLVVWINGATVATIAHEKESAIRSATEIRVPLRTGRNAVLFRLNQRQGQWQAGIRFRTLDDQVADVIGVPFAQQRLRLPASPTAAGRAP